MDKKTEIILQVHGNRLSVCQLKASDEIPDWARTTDEDFISITRTADELSIVCDEQLVPINLKQDDDWRMISVKGPLDFELIGILKAVISPLAENKISVYTVSTYDTDYILIKNNNWDKALSILSEHFKIETIPFEKISSKEFHMPLIVSASGGGVIGGFEALLAHPLWVLKTRKQLRMSFTLEPNILMRGFITQCMGTIPMDAVQIAASIYLNDHCFHNRNKQNTIRHLMAGYLGGMFSGVLISPVELVLAQQQLLAEKKNPAGKSSLQTVRLIYHNYDIQRFFLGTFGTMQRVGLFCLCFYSMIPQFKWYLQRQFKLNELSSSMISGFTLGSIMSAISHIPDTIKTRQQGDLAKPQTFIRVASTIYKSSGVTGFMDGFVARGIRITFALVLMAFLTEHFEKHYYARQQTLPQKNVVHDHFMKKMLIASIAICGNALINYPLNNIKFSQQMTDNHLLPKKSTFFSYSFFRELYRGLPVFQFGSIASLSLQRLFLDKMGLESGNNFKHLAYCSLGGLLSATILSPVEQLVIWQKKNKLGPVTNLIKLLNTHGPKRVMKGYSLTAARDAGLSYSTWGAAPLIFQYLKGKKSINASNQVLDVLSSLLASIPVILLHPLDIIKTKLQESCHQTSTKDVFRSIYAKNGIKGFSPGFFSRSVSVFGTIYFVPKLVNSLSKKFDSDEPSVERTSHYGK